MVKFMPRQRCRSQVIVFMLAKQPWWQVVPSGAVPSRVGGGTRVGGGIKWAVKVMRSEIVSR